MNYIYDIYLNLNKNLYDFFDWNKNDSIIHIKKIPIFKIDTESIKKIIEYNIKIDDDFINDLENKTELWNNNKKIKYCSLFCDNENIVAIEFNDKNESIRKSFLLIEEELEILETMYDEKETFIEFNTIKKINPILETRKQIKDKKFIERELKNINIDKLNYIFYECFSKIEKNKNKMLKELNNISTNSKAYKNLYDILKLTSTTKNKML